MAFGKTSFPDRRRGMYMRKKREILRRSRRNSFLLISLAVLSLCCVLVYKTVTLDKSASQYQATIDKYEDDVKDLEKEKSEIADYEEYKKSEQYIEDTAREKLGLIYDDEVIFQQSNE